MGGDLFICVRGIGDLGVVEPGENVQEPGEGVCRCLPFGSGELFSLV
jgi:hypothetical protein